MKRVFQHKNMSQIFLTQFPITYADSVCLENSGSNFNLKISNNEHQLVILLKNILTFNFSKDFLNSDDDYINIIEIVHEYRKITHDDLKKYSFSSANADELPPLFMDELDIEFLDGENFVHRDQLEIARLNLISTGKINQLKYTKNELTEYIQKELIPILYEGVYN